MPGIVFRDFYDGSRKEKCVREKGVRILMAGSCHCGFAREGDFSKSGERKREGKIYEETMVVLQEWYVGRRLYESIRAVNNG